MNLEKDNSINQKANSDKILLSICIPTFNRRSYLLENLSVILPQIRGNDKIELLINDNGSTDDTVIALETLMKNEDCKINLKTFPKGILPADNFKNVVERANGKYIFLLGDDDLLSPDFISILFPVLEKDELDLIHFNRLSGNQFCSNNKLHDSEFRGLQEILTFPDFIRRVMSSPNFMSSLIFKKEIWLNGSNSVVVDRYYGYEWLSRIYFGTKINSKCMYYYFPLVIMRNPSRTWTKHAFLFTMIGMYNIFEDLDKQIPGVKEKWIHRVRHSHFYDFTMSLSDIGKDPETYRPYKEEILKICNNKKERFMANLLLQFPLGGLTPWLYSKIVSITRILRKRVILERKVEF